MTAPEPLPAESRDRETLARHQQERLRRLMAALEANAFYREKLAAAGVEPRRVRSLEDLPRLPLTTKGELVASQRRRPPFGELPTWPLSRYPYLHRTSGTSGKPLYWLDTREDWATWLRCWGEVYRGAGVTAEDLIFCAFSFGPYVAHFSGLEGARAMGLRAVSGGGMGSLPRLEAIFDLGATVLVSTPTYALHLGEIAAEHGIDLAASPVRATIHAGEPGASVPNVKHRIEKTWGARCFDHAGATEVGPWGFDCLADDGAIHLNEREFIFEVIDPGSGDPVPDGTRGELVITTLARHGMPVVRYRTGDLVERIGEPCPCGRALARLRGGVLGRTDDMLVVRGVNVYPSAVDDLMRGVPEVVEYEVEVRRRGGMDDLTVKVETVPGADYGAVKRTLSETFRARLNLRLAFRQAAAGALPRYELKARRFKRVGPSP